LIERQRMELGKRIWTLWKLRSFVAASAVLAAMVALWSVAEISVAPPRLTPRALEMATGTTHVVIDTPRSTILDLRQNTYSFESLSQRAILLGNVMANGRVREAIARRARVPVDALQVAAPLTTKQPRAQVGSASQKRTSDVLKSTDQYRLSIQANPTVPVLDIYSQAPTAEGAAVLANASVTALREYLAELAASQQIPGEDRIQLVQLGRARGKVINEGIDWQVSFLAFLLTFSVSCAAGIALSRVRRGWRVAALAEQQAGG
jgi:hypothetical protein